MAKYNLYIKTQLSSYNIWEISEEQLEKVVTAYKQGLDNFTLSGKQYYLKGLMGISIFTSEKSLLDENSMKYFAKAINDLNHSFFGGNYYYTDKTLSHFGSDVISDVLGNSEYGCDKEATHDSTMGKIFIDPARIEQLSEIENEDFDLSKLIALCQEINDAYNSGNYYSVLMLVRSILDHVPPIFDKTSFNEVANNCGTKSFKDAMRHLNESSRKIADSYLHQHIRRSESTPTETQVNYSQDVDFLLGEIVRILK